MKCVSARPIVSEEQSNPLLIDFCGPSKFKEEALVGTVWRTVKSVNLSQADSRIE
jgi:hypothetical protein